MSRGCVFDPTLDADPRVAAWLRSLDEATVAELRDDVTPSFKELPVGDVEVPTTVDDADAVVSDAPWQRLHGDVLVQRAIIRKAKSVLPAWQFRAFALWFAGASRSAIAKSLGVSRTTVRCALDGGGSHQQLGALELIARSSAEFRKVVTVAANKSQEKQTARRDERLSTWFAGIDAKPELIAPLALLLVVDALADAKGEVKVADLLRHFPRSALTPCLALLKAHAFAASDGQKIRIHKRPHEKPQEKRT